VETTVSRLEIPFGVVVLTVTVEFRSRKGVMSDMLKAISAEKLTPHAGAVLHGVESTSGGAGL